MGFQIDTSILYMNNSVCLSHLISLEDTWVYVCLLQTELGKRGNRTNSFPFVCQDLAAKMSRVKGEAERVSRDRASMEEVYLSLKRGVEGDAKAFTVRLDELQARVLDADVKRDQVGGLLIIVGDGDGVGGGVCLLSSCICVLKGRGLLVHW